MLRSHSKCSFAQFNCYFNDFNGLQQNFATNMYKNA